jgi:hydrogenase-4 component E
LIFIIQSILLSISAFLLGYRDASFHLLTVGVLTLVIKPALIPWLLRRTVSQEIYTYREISQVINIPSSLLIALALTLFSYFFANSLLIIVDGSFAKVNLPIGIAGLLIGAYTLMVRREAIPQLIGVLAMENGAFFAGISISPDLPLIAELAAAFDVLIIALVMGILTRTIHENIGTTKVGALTTLKEEPNQ